jgi:hypothetical protein
MYSAKEQLIELRRLLGEEGFVNGLWAMRINANPPVPKAFTRGWKWRRDKIVNLAAYRKNSQDELEAAGSGAHRI